MIGDSGFPIWVQPSRIGDRTIPRLGDVESCKLLLIFSAAKAAVHRYSGIAASIKANFVLGWGPSHCDV